MNFTHFALFIFVVCFSKTLVDATQCKPLSTFRIDCDECRCSEDGTEYSCTAKQCGFGTIQAPDAKDSYVLDDADADADEVANPDETIEFAYLNDAAEVSSSDENNDDDEGEYYEYDEEEDPEEEWDTGIPDAYRRKRTTFRGKRYIKHGKRHVGPIGKK